MPENRNTAPDQAFILAAGLGTRLRPHTDEMPKPMVKVWGKPMIDHAIDALAAAGVKKCVINTHYKADILEDHLKTRDRGPEIKISREETLLDTGGGITNALHHFDKPFFVLSGDSVWEDAGENTLDILAKNWDADKMDILILLQPVSTMTLTGGKGDYDLEPDGQVRRSHNKTGRYMFTSIRINAPGIFPPAPAAPFSYLSLLDEAEKKGRLYGLVNKGLWHHISTPDDLKAVNDSKR